MSTYLEPIKPGQTSGRYKNNASTDEFKLLEGIAGNVAEAARTLEFEVPRNAEELMIGVNLSTQGAATAVVFAPSGSLDGTAFHEWTSRATSSGTGTLSVFTESLAVSGAKSFLTSYDVRGLKKLKVVLSFTGADGSEVIDAYASVATTARS